MVVEKSTVQAFDNAVIRHDDSGAPGVHRSSRKRVIVSPSGILVPRPPHRMKTVISALSNAIPRLRRGRAPRTTLVRRFVKNRARRSKRTYPHQAALVRSLTRAKCALSLVGRLTEEPILVIAFVSTFCSRGALFSWGGA
jgi:hypothetical protein